MVAYFLIITPKGVFHHEKALIIGSTVVDVIVNLVDSLPTTGEDVHVRSQHMSLGGCAYNVSDSVRHFQVPYILFLL